MNAMIFKTRLTLFWLLCTICLFAYIAAVCVGVFYENVPIHEAMTSKVSFILLAIPCMFLLAFPNRLELTDESLYVRNGFFKKRLSYSNIISVSKSINPLSSPWAWSLFRVKISYKKEDNKSASFILIAPQNREQFIRELSNRLSE